MMTQEDGRSVELRNAAKVVAEALSWLGGGFNPDSDGDLDRAVQYVSDLAVTDPAKYDNLVAVLLEASVRASEGVVDSQMPKHGNSFVPTLTYTGHTPADHFLMDDAPTQGHLLSALDTIARATGIAKR
ncbi:hypothetical protein P3T43_006960 [Paraburkholderia sp. GAS41]|uniref:hypothetical protein n=1 Tax=Paraburkholderia sp. GAS41 TaxID=3035134 RepID=UPI003D1EB052